MDAPSNAPSNAVSNARPMLQAMHATNATNATDERDQDLGEKPRVLDAGNPVDNEILWCSGCSGEGRDPWTNEPCDDCRGFGWFDTVTGKPVAVNPLRFVKPSWLLDEAVAS